MIALGKRPGLICKGAQPVDVYVGGHPVTPGIALEDYPLQAASGSVVTCEPLTGYKLGVTSHITAVQEGTGDPSPDNVRPIVGWDSVSVTRCGRNLVDIPDYIETNANVIKLSTIPIFEAVKYKDNTQYTLSADIIMTATDSWFGASIYYTDGTHEYARMAGKYNNNPYTTAPDKTVASIAYTYYVNAIVTVKNTQLLEGATATPYEPYTGETHTRALPETVYGGTLDWRTGLLTVTHGHIGSYAGEVVPDGWVSSVGALIEGAQVVYPLNTPYTIQLTPQQLVALAGTNTIYSNSGDTTVTYRIRKT